MNKKISTEKKIAIISVLISMLIPALYVFANSKFASLDDFLHFGEGLLLFWFALFLGCGLYMRLRSAAVTGAALATTSLFAFFFYNIYSSGDPKIGGFWLIYLFWTGIAFLMSLYPAFAKPKVFIQSWKSAFFSALGYSYLSLVVSILITKLL